MLPLDPQGWRLREGGGGEQGDAGSDSDVPALH